MKNKARDFFDSVGEFFSRNKTIKIVTLAIVGILLVSATVFAVTYRPVKDISQDTQFQAIPTDSRDYSVEEAPISKVDSDEPKDDKAPTSDKNKPGTFKDMNGNRIKHDDRVRTDPKMTQIPNIGQRFKIPSVGLDVSLGKVNEVNGLIRPTNYTSVFYVANKGVPYNKTNKGTTYIVMHALDKGGVAPGNFLIDSNTRQVRVSNGADIYAGSKKFKVVKSFRAGKSLISQNSDIWNAKIKGRMVIITCFPNSNDNQVIIAQRDWSSR